MEKFWIVKKAPANGARMLVGDHNTIYDSLKEAEKRAESLTSQYGEPYMILVAVAVYRRTSPPVERVEFKERCFKGHAPCSCYDCKGGGLRQGY